MIFEDLNKLTNTQLEEVKELINQILENRRKARQEEALAEVKQLIEKWNKEKIYFYIWDKNCTELLIVPNDIYVQE